MSQAGQGNQASDAGLAGVSPALAAVRAALGEPVAALGPWEALPLTRGASGRPCHLLEGTARVAASDRPWRLVLKVYPRTADSDDPAGAVYWRREPLLFAAGCLPDAPGGLRAPRCYGQDEAADGALRLWLEYVQEDPGGHWTLAQWALAARHLGQWTGSYAAGRPLPPSPALRGRRLRNLLERQRPLLRRIEAAPHNPEVRRWWPQPVVDAVLGLWRERDAFCAALERLPQAFGHGDAIRRNLLLRRGAGAGPETVAIDWEHAGQYAVGEDIGQTLSVAAAFFDVAPAELPSLDGALFEGYLAGLAEAGWRGDRRAVRLAHTVHAALRNAFNAVGATLPDAAGRASAVQRYGHTWEELAQRRAELRPHLLARAQEARALLATL